MISFVSLIKHTLHSLLLILNCLLYKCTFEAEIQIYLVGMFEFFLLFLYLFIFYFPSTSTILIHLRLYKHSQLQAFYIFGDVVFMSLDIMYTIFYTILYNFIQFIIRLGVLNYRFDDQSIVCTSIFELLRLFAYFKESSVANFKEKKFSVVQDSETFWDRVAENSSSQQYLIDYSTLEFNKQ